MSSPYPRGAFLFRKSCVKRPVTGFSFANTTPDKILFRPSFPPTLICPLPSVVYLFLVVYSHKDYLSVPATLAMSTTVSAHRPGQFALTPFEAMEKLWNLVSAIIRTMMLDLCETGTTKSAYKCLYKTCRSDRKKKQKDENPVVKMIDQSPPTFERDPADARRSRK